MRCSLCNTGIRCYPLNTGKLNQRVAPVGKRLAGGCSAAENNGESTCPSNGDDTVPPTLLFACREADIHEKITINLEVCRICG